MVISEASVVVVLSKYSFKCLSGTVGEGLYAIVVSLCQVYDDFYSSPPYTML